ncbi:hypothetical protein HZH68_016500 [Vespula germanica]|uniref:Uncharacterized protein n=1 Tax=Vespula germanica TaxID=30212 RepID=A0A834J307_VESGE|nr:hypothetical protein HZH68_016500 [Vespula germanica]
MYPTIEALRQTSEADIFLLFGRMRKRKRKKKKKKKKEKEKEEEEEASRGRSVVEFDGWNVSELVETGEGGVAAVSRKFVIKINYSDRRKECRPFGKNTRRLNYNSDFFPGSLGRFKDFGNLSVPADVERPQKGEKGGKGGIVGRLVVGWVKGGGGSVSPSSDSAPPESTEITCCHVGEDKTRTRRMQAVPTSDLG